MDELANRSPNTRKNYLKDFQKFTDYTGLTADELLTQRKQNQKADDIREQRQIETLLLKFIAKEETDGYSPATRQRIFAAVRSFFEINYLPLQMRHGDYPQGEGIGVRAATKETILKAVTRPETGYNPINNAAILTIKDSGLRASDTIRLNYGDVAEGIEKQANFIPITIITQKKKIIAKTFIGHEAIEAIKEAIEARRKGTRRVPPEKITKDSPLFTTWNQSHNRISRTGLSNLIRKAFLDTEETNLSAHSLRKYFQTQLEEAGISVNWIDQMIGHALINSRDAYSKPTDEKLKAAYEKAYKFLAIYPLQDRQENPKSSQQTNQITEPAATPKMEEMQLQLQILQLQLKIMQSKKT